MPSNRNAIAACAVFFFLAYFYLSSKATSIFADIVISDAHSATSIEDRNKTASIPASIRTKLDVLLAKLWTKKNYTLVIVTVEGYDLESKALVTPEIVKGYLVSKGIPARYIYTNISGNVKATSSHQKGKTTINKSRIVVEIIFAKTTDKNGEAYTFSTTLDL